MNSDLSLPKTVVQIPENLEVITLGAGCFWCTEAVFQRLNGVEKVISGYSGGFVVSPSYQEICTGTTGHAEVVQVYFDPKKIGLVSILEIFWATHDPTTLNRQGSDTGAQYRSAVFFHNPEQEAIVKSFKKQLDEAMVFENPIVTEITDFSNFYPAENYHQDYYSQNGSQPYCQFVIRPKVDKLKKYFRDKLKDRNDADQ